VEGITLPKKKGKNDSVMDGVALEELGVHLIYSDIDEESAADVCEFIIKANFAFPAKMVLTLMINSNGGTIYDGWGIVDLIECSRLQVQTVGIGGIFSMAAVIFTAGTPGRRIMTKNSYLMTHQFSDELASKYNDFVAHRPHQDELHNRFVKHFVDRTKMSEQDVRDILLGPTDKYLSARECLDYGICDVIKDPWE
jgi:ATP-dependent Clp protease protease subunit